MKDRNLVKGNVYFIALNDGEVYQGEYRGWHRETGCYWFAPLMFANAVSGPQWVHCERIWAVIDLGAPTTNTYFNLALNGILE